MKVFLGSRNAEKGAKAVEDVISYCGGGCGGGDDVPVELLVIDVANDESVNTAAKSLKDKDVKLYAIINNAGTGLAHEGVTDKDVINVNLYGPKRVVDAFAPLLDPAGSKIINTGSGAGPMYVNAQTSSERKRLFCNPEISWEDIDKLASAGCSDDDPARGGWAGLGPYGLSKALLYCYTMYTARTMADKKVASFCLSPGFIATNIVPTDYRSNAKPVEEGTVSLKHCLFNATLEENNGWFYGSDAKRSPPYVLRNPGEPEFDGKLPDF